ncbi:hypothetical protein UA08_02682 [Talaromyces atroroseus]|uniref:protein-tyrosine-phosphatase n=1 Tax=Talaromyces atroroseus TaxID=1441469 RepID=A0A225AM61_TALAT|nr:hypothetical protein UA08_02682 [Talaromyces atroroseus]OKL61980.1 hypothetical protein UA08_02682 [Talaromyces atroroseus]
MQSSTTRQSPSSSPWGTDHHSRQLGAILNSSATLPMQSSALNGPMASPFLFPRDSSDGVGSGGSATSTNYFGLPVDNTSNPPGSNPGPHTKRNWDTLTQPYSSLPSPRLHRVSPNPVQKHILSLVGSESQVVQQDPSRIGDHTTDVPPTGSESNRDAPFLPGRTVNQGGGSKSQETGMEIDEYPGSVGTSRRGPFTNLGMNLELPKTYSPATYQSTNSSPIPRPSLSLPPAATHTPSPNRNKSDHRRADTLPTALEQVPISFISAETCEQLLQTVSQTTLLLDVRPYPQFSQANIMESLNLCIPTTLLKRPSFNTDKLTDTFANEHEKSKFSSWKECTYIIVYDSNTEQPRDATQLINVLKKFKVEGWLGEAKILRGGFAAFASRFPNRVRQQRRGKANTSNMQPRPMSLNLPSTVPVAGGCSLPEVPASEPFFGNIRQNMDLVGGVGQIPVKLPDGLTPSRNRSLPSWLRTASAHEDKGHNVSQKFLNIEERELHRMREALSPKANYNETSSTKFRVAGIEKGSKNRYNDIYPFDHTRVRLQDIPTGDCDYVNGNYLKAKLTNKSYIATQAPIPDTFDDFWRVIWEQDVRVIVALTAEVERGQIKCHPYWNKSSYGPFKVKPLGERRVYMDPKTAEATDDSQQNVQSLRMPSVSGKSMSSEGLYNAGDERPFIFVRHFTLSHAAYPFQPIREITQLQYSYWPDFGTTSQPAHLLKLVEQCNKITRSSSGLHLSDEDVEPPDSRPVVVHCSAGCGRTGTFCTVDSVLDMLKQQRLMRKTAREITNDEKWMFDDSVDLVAKTVEDFRTQRPSMVQNLSQFVLCYETILEWAVAHIDEQEAGNS